MTIHKKGEGKEKTLQEKTKGFKKKKVSIIALPEPDARVLRRKENHSAEGKSSRKSYDWWKDETPIEVMTSPIARFRGGYKLGK